MERRMHARPWIAHAQHDFASMLLTRGRAGDAERAAQLMAAARATYAELEMGEWVDRASADGAMGGARGSSSARTKVRALRRQTPRDGRGVQSG
jgi:hypothetical protein